MIQKQNFRSRISFSLYCKAGLLIQCLMLTKVLASNAKEVVFIDSNKQTYRFLPFVFEGYSSSGLFEAKVSKSQLISLSAKESRSFLLRINLPQGCMIGGTAIKNGDVLANVSGRYVKNLETVLLERGAYLVMQLVFAKEGGYGKSYGPVSCTQEGHLSVIK